MKKPDAFESMKQAVAKGRMSRREFVQLALAAGVTATAAQTMFSSAARAEPKKGGHFVNALTGGGTSDTLDPGKIPDTFLANFNNQMRNALVEIGADGNIKGEIAESWEAGDGATTWRFKLRSGVTFHNGKTLDANDVVASFNHHRGEGNSSAANSLAKQIKDVKADGDTVVFTLGGPNADWPVICSDYHFMICPAKADGKMDWESGIGTGGYVLKKFQPGVVANTERNPNYWKANHAWFDSIESLLITDVVARTNAVVSGSAHSMCNIDLKTIGLLQQNPAVKVVSVAGNKHGVTCMNCTVAPFDNVDVRLALKYIVKRDEIVAKILGGQGEIGNDTPIGPANTYRATADELPQRQYDPEKAKFHLKKAGLSTLKVQLNTANTSFPIDAALLIAESAKAAGIEIEVVREAEDSYWDVAWMKKPWTGSYWSGRATEDWMFSQAYAKGAAWNETFWDNARFNELLIAARGELDTGKRREMYVEMQRIVHEDGGVTVPYFQSFTHAVSSKIGLPEQIGRSWTNDSERNCERWWFA